jgi:uncharacterized membrane protein
MAKSQSARRTTARPAASARKASPGGPARNGTRAANGTPAATAAPAAAEPPVLAPPWLRLTALGLTIVGLGFSVYLTITHLHPQALVCSAHGIVNCEAVTTSAQSKVFGIFPVAELGLAFYVFLLAINLPWAWKREVLPAAFAGRPLNMRWIRLASLVVGIGFVLYLVYVELIQLGNICLYCTGVHIVTFLLFVLIVFDSVFRQAPATTAALASAKRTKG